MIVVSGCKYKNTSIVRATQIFILNNNNNNKLSFDNTITQSSIMTSVKICDRKGKELLIVNNTTDNTTVEDLKQAFEQKYKKWYLDRQYYTIGLDNKTRIVLKNEDLISKYKTQLQEQNNIIYFKDLGPQISWKTVFHVEYFGPILIHTLNYFFPALFYGSANNKTMSLENPIWNQYYTIQTVCYICILLHFIKRELETHFIHRFSNSTMPLQNIFKNSIHYWIFSGLFISYFLYHPLYTPSTFLFGKLIKSKFLFNGSEVVLYAVIVGLFLYAESGNLACHIILRDLRPAGSKKRGIPKGNLFSIVSCANYTWELLAWAVLAVAMQCVTGYIFLFISFAQIAQWSLKKHHALIKEFGKHNAKPYALIPFIF